VPIDSLQNHATAQSPVESITCSSIPIIHNARGKRSQLDQRKESALLLCLLISQAHVQNECFSSREKHDPKGSSKQM